MSIDIHLDRVMLERKMSLLELSKRVGITNVNLSKLKTGKVSAIRLSTLEAICDALDCQPGDILEFKRDERPPEKKEPGEDGCRQEEAGQAVSDAD
ncbi:MAG: helix-turn-helix transcriptional regulator [Candidatus Methanomethylophilaceae archaeon]|nr:helix-turn-helix transcriptional regulator [Candidatus Methanomethylophilaceae archaeon]